MEKIPEFLEIEAIRKNSKGQFKPVKDIIPLREKDLPRAATFESHLLELQVNLVCAKGVLDPNTGIYEKVPNSELKVKFKGGKLLVVNSNVLNFLMGSTAYRCGDIYPDKEDPTGLWQELGVIETEKVTVVKNMNVVQPKYGDYDFKNVKEPSEKENREPLAELKR